MLLSIVDRQRYGLLEHAEALNVFYKQSTGCDSILLKHANLVSDIGSNFSFYLMLKILFSGKVNVCVIWSVGSTYCLLPIITLLLRNIKFFVVIHEPGGFSQRKKRGDPLIYSLTTTLYEKLLCFSIVTRLTPNIKNIIVGKLLFVPLIFSEKIQVRNLINRNQILYLGRKSVNRSYDLFEGEMLDKFLGLLGKDELFKFFPTPELYTSSDKDHVMACTLCVLNLYRVNHNQSGVTPDALRYGVPVIVTEKDAYSELIIEYSAGVVIDSKKLSHKAIFDAIYTIKKNKNLYISGALELYSTEFGFRAFAKHWLPLFA